jgi:hypothetical protein
MFHVKTIKNKFIVIYLPNYAIVAIFVTRTVLKEKYRRFINLFAFCFMFELQELKLLVLIYDLKHTFLVNGVPRFCATHLIYFRQFVCHFHCIGWLFTLMQLWHCQTQIPGTACITFIYVVTLSNFMCIL